MSPAVTHYQLGGVQHLPLTYDPRDSEASALKLILTLVPEWADDDSRIEFKRFTDGITNTLLKVVNRRSGLSKQDIDRDAILLRAYGNGTAILIDREREAANHELLMKHDLAPDLLARFENGMLYRYIVGDVAQPQDLREPLVVKAVARRLAEWHATVPCLHKLPHANGKVNGHHRTDESNGFQQRIMTAASGKPYPNLWTTMQKWILALPTETEQQRERQSMLQQEMNELVSRLNHRPGLGHNGLVFAHCDLLSANIILHRDEGEVSTVSFIDYEYATPSPAAFDVANHFAEWAGYECDYTAVPNVAQRRAFIREYVRTYAELSEEPMDFEAETERLENEVNIFRGVPGFYWGIWASIQATISDIDFDYASYSELRLGEYWAFKGEEDGSRKSSGADMPLRERTWWRS